MGFPYPCYPSLSKGFFFMICGLPRKFTRVIEVYTMIDTGAMIGTAKLSVMVAFCNKYPWLVKVIIDSADVEFQ